MRARAQVRASSLSGHGRATAVVGLDRRTRNRAIGAEYATVASEGLKPRPAALAVIEEHAGIGWHCLHEPMSTCRASQRRFQLHRRSQRTESSARHPGLHAAPEAALRYWFAIRVNLIPKDQ
jgi:hypothetical protein